MNYTDFKEKIIKKVSEIMGEEVEIKVARVIKNNSVKLDGMSIFNKDEKVSPTIYLKDFYDKHLSGESVDAIVDEIIEIYNKYSIKTPINIDFFNEFETISSSIVFKVVNYNKNIELLEKIPYIKYMDLAVVFYCLLGNGDCSGATILINNKHLEMWNITIADITKAAVSNTPKLLECEVKGMAEIIRDEMKESFDVELEEAVNEMDSEIPMYVMTNKRKINGAACILYPDMVKQFAEKIDCDLYILPSSVHEVIMIPKQSVDDNSVLKKMVKDVNETQVSVEEILSDSVYYYNRSKDAIEIA